MDENPLIYPMANPNLKRNTDDLSRELEWFGQLLRKRIQWQVEKKEGNLKLSPPSLRTSRSIYAAYVNGYKLNPEERVVLILGLLPAIQPFLIERVLQEFQLTQAQMPEIGGVRGTHHGGLLPTGETAIFLLAGNDIGKRMEVSLFFSPKHVFHVHGILKLDEVSSLEPEWSGAIHLSRDILTNLTSGTRYYPPFNSSFPARLITTSYEPSQLVVRRETSEGLEEVRLWLKHKDHILKKWHFDTKINEGYKCLFYGPPGTGKSLAAALLGKELGLPVYRIDLSMVVSKYIGETEKNISQIFDMAQNKNWVLFFDEADALFGKRAVTQTAQDRFSNQEVAHLLIKMDEYNGLAILSTNFLRNVDKAFLRRFNSVVPFLAPGMEERLQLWQQSFSPQTIRDKSVKLENIARDFALSGANIMNVVRYASVMALRDGGNIIKHHFIMDGIRKELAKEQAMSAETAN